MDEAGDILKGFFTTTSSPWLQSRLISGMDEVFLARIRLEATHQKDPGRVFAEVEAARGRSLLELLVNRPLCSQQQPRDLQTGARRVAVLQRQLLATTDRSTRQRLLDQIFAAEEQLAPASTALFDSSRRLGTRRAIGLRDLQRVLAPDEVFLEYVLLDPDSCVLVATSTSARVQELSGGKAIRSAVDGLLKRIREGQDPAADASQVATLLTGTLPEVATRQRVIVSPDGDLHQLSFDLLPGKDGRRLLQSHVFSYVPSGSVLKVLRTERPGSARSLRALAVSASPAAPSGAVRTGKAVTRDLYDLDATQLRHCLRLTTRRGRSEPFWDSRPPRFSSETARRSRSSKGSRSRTSGRYTLLSTGCPTRPRGSASASRRGRRWRAGGAGDSDAPFEC